MVNKKAHFQGKCYNCGKYGHMAKDCRLPQKNPKVHLNAAMKDDSGSKHEVCMGVASASETSVADDI